MDALFHKCLERQHGRLALYALQLGADPERHNAAAARLAAAKTREECEAVDISSSSIAARDARGCYFAGDARICDL
jgi:hypothetical protein